MLQLRNQTPFDAAVTVFPDETGADAVWVAVKATFTLSDRLQIAEAQVPPTGADTFWETPGESSLRYASDMHPSKPGTDVVLVGHAWPPPGRQADHLDVSVCVGERRSTVRAFGDREWRGGLRSPSPSAPVPFDSMPLVYERAFGGVAPADDAGGTRAEERNPVGVGFLGDRRRGELRGERLPNLEHPAHLIRSPGDRVPPAGFGFIAPAWLPRRSYAGTYDAAWLRTRAPFLPVDFDARFFHAAHPDLVFPTPLRGDEPVEVLHASRRGPLGFRLPGCLVRVTARIAGRAEDARSQLETVLIEPDLERLCLLWRAKIPCDKAALRVDSIALDLAEMDRVARA